MVANANNPVWIIRNHVLIELKADKMPVGKHDSDYISFTEHSIELEKGDMIYTLTDGMADQFGGPKGKKFKYKQLQDLLTSIASKPLAEQKVVLDTTIENWRGSLDQVDDILIIGIRV